MLTSRLTQPARRGARRAVAACLKRKQSACASVGSSVPYEHEREAEARETFLERFQTAGEGSFREQMVYSLSYAGDNLASDLESDDSVPLIDDRMKRQLRNSYNALLSPSNYDAQNLASDLESDDTVPLIDDRMKQQLRNSYNALLSPSNYDAQNLRSRLPPMNLLGDSQALANLNVERMLPPLEGDEDIAAAKPYSQPLPKSINDISSSKLDEDSRAMVITETKNPFRVVAVNTAWEDLCGYQRDECQGVSLGHLLQGPETNMPAVMSLVSKLLAGEEAGTVLTNYTKHGRKFKNDIRVRPIVDEMGKTINFIGVLRELKDDEELLGNFEGDGRKMKLPFMS